MSSSCNQCGGSCESPNHQDAKEPPSYGLIDAKVKGYYSSYALVDLTEYTFSLCEGCLKKLFEGFAIPVSTREYPVWEDLPPLPSEAWGVFEKEQEDE